MKEKLAKGLVRRYMLCFGFKGFASPWQTIYYMDDNPTKYLVAHEKKHIEQMGRYSRYLWLSVIIFLVKYIYYLIKDGYKLNKYEIEARDVNY